MKNKKSGFTYNSSCCTRKGSALILVTVGMVVLSTLGLGMLALAYGTRHNAIKIKNETISMLAAEAGYEQAVFWMSQQKDMLSTLHKAKSDITGELSVPQGTCDYKIGLFSFAGSRPVYRIVSNGHSGSFTRTVDVLVLQAISGWDMGMCRVPLGSTSTAEVYFADKEIIDMPLHINDYGDNPDNIDIHIKGDPQFLQTVSMGESRYSGGGGYDKYYSVMSTFDEGICFDQPDNRITDQDIVKDKIERFEDSTKDSFCFKPQTDAQVNVNNAALQIEFFVENGIGKIRITDNCQVVGHQQNSDSKTYDFKIKAGSSGRYERYDIYGYHYMPKDAEATGQRFTVDVEDTYVTQSFGGVESQLGGQIYVDGNVVIGGDKTEHNGDQLVKGRISIVATGNIWIADSVILDGPHDADGKPSDDNPNILGLVAQGVIKVVDPGISGYSDGGTNNYPGPPEIESSSSGSSSGSSGGSSGGRGGFGGRGGSGSNSSGNSSGSNSNSSSNAFNGFEYAPVGRSDGSKIYDRVLPDPTIVEAALTVGGGGWGAENVQRGSYGGRKEYSGSQDELILRGTITESIRGVVGLVGGDGYLKNYYFDDRVLEGILPGDIWLQGKYVPSPAGWSDYRVSK